LKQGLAQHLFQHTYLLADGTVGQAEFFGGLAHALVARHGIEDDQAAGGGDVTAHGAILWHVRKTDSSQKYWRARARVAWNNEGSLSPTFA
jgi:hypothetical protein